MITEECKFDFNAVLPMPPEIEQATCSSDADIAWSLKYGDWGDAAGRYGPDQYTSRDEAEAAARLDIADFDGLADNAEECLARFGHRDWYSWAWDNWDTKWNACYTGWMSPARTARRHAEQVAYFDTAWSPPYSVIRELSVRFPTLTLRLSYFEPDLCFSGFFTLVAGEEVASKHEEPDSDCEDCELTAVTHLLQVSKEGERQYVYIGDARPADSHGPEFPRSPWASPFAVSTYTDEEAAELYRLWLLGDEDATKLVDADVWTRPCLDTLGDQLKGKMLVCDCTREKCHGDILLALAFNEDTEPENLDDDERDSDLC